MPPLSALPESVIPSARAWLNAQFSRVFSKFTAKIPVFGVQTVLLPESFRGGCSFGAAWSYIDSLSRLHIEINTADAKVRQSADIACGIGWGAKSPARCGNQRFNAQCVGKYSATGSTIISIASQLSGCI